MTPEHDLTIRNGNVVALGGTGVTDVGIRDGRITSIASGLLPGRTDIDATGLTVAPGAIDPHTHFARMSRRSQAQSVDDYETATGAALLGGVTTVINCAFQELGEDIDDAIEREHDLARGSHIDHSFHIAVTDLSVPGTIETIGTLRARGFTSIKTFTSLPPYMLSKGDLITVLSAAAEHDLIVNVHAEDHALCSHLTQGLIESGKDDVAYFPQARPSVAEALAVREMCVYGEATGASLYFIYLSSRAGVAEASKARRAGSRVFVETRPLYLFLDQSRYQLPPEEANKYVCLPPLRTIEDQDSLWQMLATGEIDTYATDHVAWNSEQKGRTARPFTEIPAGVANVQTSVGMLYAEGVVKGRINIERFVEIVASNPARIFGLWPRKGQIAVGADADVVLFDPLKEMRISHEDILTRADFEVFEGWSCVGWPVATVSQGEIVARGGRLSSRPGRGRFIARASE